MNFLLTITYKDSWYALPEKERTEIVTEVIAFHEKYLKSGKLKDTYTFIEGKLMSIWNVDSFDEMVVIRSEHPYSIYVNYEAAPFIDHKEIVKLRSKNLATVKKSS